MYRYEHCIDDAQLYNANLGIVMCYYCISAVLTLLNVSFTTTQSLNRAQMQNIKEGLYRIWCGVNRLDVSGVNTLSDTSAFVNPAGQLLLTRRGKTRMDGFGIVFEFYIAPL